MATLAVQGLVFFEIYGWVSRHGEVSAFGLRGAVPWFCFLWLYGVRLPDYGGQIALTVVGCIGLFIFGNRWSKHHYMPRFWGHWVLLLSIVGFLALAYWTRPAIRYD